MGEEAPPVQKSAKQLEKEAKKAAEKAAKLEKLAAKQAKQVSQYRVFITFEVALSIAQCPGIGSILSWNKDLLRNDGEGGLGRDPAHIAVGPGHPHVAGLAPVLAPAVLQDVIFLPSILIHPVTHGQHRVVKMNFATGLRSVNSSFIMSETPMV